MRVVDDTLRTSHGVGGPLGFVVYSRAMRYDDEEKGRDEGVTYNRETKTALCKERIVVATVGVSENGHTM